MKTVGPKQTGTMRRAPTTAPETCFRAAERDSTGRLLASFPRPLIGSADMGVVPVPVQADVAGATQPLILSLPEDSSPPERCSLRNVYNALAKEGQELACTER